MVLVPCWQGLVVIGRHWGGGRVSHAAHTWRHRSQSGVGLRALGPRGSWGDAGGGRTRWTPVTAVTSCVRRKACTPSRATGAGRGWRGTGAAPWRLVGVTPRTSYGSPLVVTTRRSKGVPGRSCQRTCPLWRAPLVLERGGDRRELAQLRGACVAGARVGHQMASLGNASHTTAYGGVGLVPSYTGLVGRGRLGVSPAPSTNILTSPTSKSSYGGCRRCSAASSSDTPPRYVARAWFRYRAAPLGAACPQGVQQGWEAAVEGRGRLCARQRQGVPQGKGPARPVVGAPLHPVPVEGCVRAYEPWPDGVHDLVHRWE